MNGQSGSSPGPAGPVAPRWPRGPTSPCGPATPCSPCGPGGPIGPGAPGDPAAPGAPAGPTGPTAPGAPGRPGGPIGPDAPGVPGGPAGPGNPGAPCSPAAPCGPPGPGTDPPGPPGGPAGPGNPGTPCSPGAPCGPTGPGAPDAPAGPAGPAGPGNPGTPCSPGAPCGPAGPGAPGAPAGPGGPTVASTVRRSAVKVPAPFGVLHKLSGVGVVSGCNKPAGVLDEREAVRAGRGTRAIGMASPLSSLSSSAAASSRVTTVNSVGAPADLRASTSPCSARSVTRNGPSPSGSDTAAALSSESRSPLGEKAIPGVTLTERSSKVARNPQPILPKPMVRRTSRTASRSRSCMWRMWSVVTRMPSRNSGSGIACPLLTPPKQCPHREG